MQLAAITIVLVKTRFPENIGMVARACANMGATDIILVDPERWDIDKARPLATPKGEPLLDTIRVVDDLATALADHTLVWGTTARTGGWRRSILSPRKAAESIRLSLGEGERVAIVFGPEDRGLNNEEIELCGQLLTIPTEPSASSLNLAQAVLIVLYECFAAMQQFEDTPAPLPTARRITHSEQELLFTTIKGTLLDIDYLPQTNPDYFLMPLRRFMGKGGLRRGDFDMLMGMCRQVRRIATLAQKPSSTEK